MANTRITVTASGTYKWPRPGPEGVADALKTHLTSVFRAYGLDDLKLQIDLQPLETKENDV